MQNLQGALPDPPAGSAPPDVVQLAEFAHAHSDNRDPALPDPEASRVADADTSLARLAPHSRAGGRGRRSGRGCGHGRRLADDNPPAPLPEANTAADDPEGAAAQRQVAVAEDGMRIGLPKLESQGERTKAREPEREREPETLYVRTLGWGTPRSNPGWGNSKFEPRARELYVRTLGSGTLCSNPGKP